MKTSDFIITRANYDTTNNLQAVDIFGVDENDKIYSAENISRNYLISLLCKNKIIYTGKFNYNNTYTKISPVYLHNNFQSRL